MAKIKTDELIGPSLDWAVQEIEYQRMVAEGEHVKQWALDDHRAGASINHYSTDWFWGGPLLDLEGISIRLNHKQSQLWEAYIWLPTQHDLSEADSNSYTAFGMTALIAAMRCFCCSRLGSEIEVPDELL